MRPSDWILSSTAKKMFFVVLSAGVEPAFLPSEGSIPRPPDLLIFVLSAGDSTPTGSTMNPCVQVV